ncbi:MAG TPA: hypothetical protein VFQ35_21275 [Polyangiaceae bacterium]|nr:hypothetical protein [Polyangiaceae bacterium]
MSTEAESAPAKSPSNAPNAPRKKKKKVVKRKLTRPLTEQEINAPDMQTMVMVGCLGVMTIILWAWAHAGCNYHPPRETRRPRDVTTAELTREPKDAAIEFQHRLLTRNFKGALEIAAGSAVDAVKQEQAKCDANRAACAQEKSRLGDAVTSATVLERTPANAKVRATSYHLPNGNQTFLNLVERDATGWKVTARVPDGPGATLPAPILPPPAPLHFNVTPAGSGGGIRLMPPDHPGASSPPSAPAAPGPASSPAAPKPALVAPAPASSK